MIQPAFFFKKKKGCHSSNLHDNNLLPFEKWDVMINEFVEVNNNVYISKLQKET